MAVIILISIYVISKVSRCGMVYMEPLALGWRPLVETWLAKLPQTLTQQHKAVLTALFHRFVPPLLAFVRKHLLWFKLERSESYVQKGVSPTTDLNLVQSLMNIFDCFLDEFTDPAYTKHHPESDIRAHLEVSVQVECFIENSCTLKLEYIH